MKDINTLVKDIERDLVLNLVMSVKYERITKSESKKIAKEFLDKPFNSYKNIFEGLYDLRDYREIRKIYVKYAPDYYLEKAEIELKKLRNTMNSRLKGEINYGQ